MAQLVYNTYADALLQLAIEEGGIDTYETKAKALLAIFHDNKDFRIVVEHPEISKEDKLKMLVSAIGEETTDSFAGLFNLILNKNREKDLFGILETFLKKLDAHKGIVVAKVESPTKIDEDRLQRIRQQIADNLQKTVNLEFYENPALAGGLKITVDGHVIDATIVKEIEDLRKSLHSVK